MKQPKLVEVLASVTVVAASALAAGPTATHSPDTARRHRSTTHVSGRLFSKSRSPIRAAKKKPGMGKRMPGLAGAARSAARPAPARDRLFIAAGSQITDPSPERLAVMKAESKSEHAVADLVKTGDLATATAVCRSAMAASAAVHSGVAVPRLRHMLGTISLAAGRYADAYRIFEDIGHHNGEFYSSEDFDLDVALAAVHVGNPRHAEFLVRRYLGTFDPHGFEGRLNLLPGFATPAAALATIHAARGVNYSGTGRDEEARVELNIAAQIAPNNAYIALVRGIALHFTGHDEQARACLEVAMRSDDPDVRTGAEGWTRNVLEAEAKKKAEAEKNAEAKSNPGAGK